MQLGGGWVVGNGDPETSRNSLRRIELQAGLTSSLTTGVDAHANFTGGSGNDTFIATIDGTTNAVTSTLSPLDSLDGGAGVGDAMELDILNGVGAAGAALAALPAVTVANIETVNTTSSRRIINRPSSGSGNDQFSWYPSTSHAPHL